TPWTTTPTTSWPGTKAAAPRYRTSASPAGNTTGSGTPPAGNPSTPAATNHQAGYHPPAGTTQAKKTTGNHPGGPPTPPAPPGRGKPPGWVSPPGRHYPSEENDWEPPWRPHEIHLPTRLRPRLPIPG